MKYDTRSYGQKLEDMFDEDTGGAHRDPDPDELFEEQDAESRAFDGEVSLEAVDPSECPREFRHFDSYTFAPANTMPLRANGGEPCYTTQCSPPPSFGPGPSNTCLMAPGSKGCEARGGDRNIASQPSTFARAASLTGRWEWDRANGGVAVDGELACGAPPTQTGPSPIPRDVTGSEAGGNVTRPPGPPGLASNIERWMWTP